ncbi:hypothetical protein ACWD7C_37950 [Streptomyces sp. NPDC005134]
MKTESTDIITHVCWDMDPQTAAHHEGDHYDPLTRRSWNHPGTTWPK